MQFAMVKKIIIEYSRKNMYVIAQMKIVFFSLYSDSNSI